MIELAYLDPGSGSILLQALLGGFAGLAVLFKVFGAKLWRSVAFWQKAPGTPEISAADDSGTAAPAADKLDGPT